MTISRQHLLEVQKFLPKCDLKNMSEATVKVGCISMDGDLELRKKTMILMNAVEGLMECYENIEKES